MAGRAAAKVPIARVGQALSRVGTPALVLDLDAFDQNARSLVHQMQVFEKRGPDGKTVALRPHAKAHKCSALALRQMDLLGSAAVGLGCQTLAEAEILASAGLKDLTITNEVVPIDKVQRLAKLAKMEGLSLGVCVDSAVNVRQISKELQAVGATIKVLVECNVGQNRCGVETAEEAVELAKVVKAFDGVLEFDGYQAYHGAIQHVRGEAERSAECRKVAEKVVALNAAFDTAGIKCNTVTGGGTGTFLFDAGSGLYTEVQPGSYFFGDVDYGKNDWGRSKGWTQSLLVAATVISRNPSRRTVVVDAGLKAVDLGSGPPLVLGEEQWSFANGGDEHGVVTVPEGDLPEVGERMYLIPSHVDPTFNMHRQLVCVRGEVVEDVLEIDASGPGF